MRYALVHEVRTRYFIWIKVNCDYCPMRLQRSFPTSNDTTQISIDGFTYFIYAVFPFTNLFKVYLSFKLLDCFFESDVIITSGKITLFSWKTNMHAYLKYFCLILTWDIISYSIDFLSFVLTCINYHFTSYSFDSSYFTINMFLIIAKARVIDKNA